MPSMSLQVDLTFNPWTKWIQTHPEIVHGPCIFTCGHRVGRRNSVVSLQRLIEGHVIEKRYQKISGHNEWFIFLFLEKGDFISFIMVINQFFIRLSYIIRPTTTSKHCLLMSPVRKHIQEGSATKLRLQKSKIFQKSSVKSVSFSSLT